MTFITLGFMKFDIMTRDFRTLDIVPNKKHENIYELMNIFCQFD